MKYFDSFTGVGGFSLAVPKDWECVGFAEIDKYANMVLRYRFPNVKNYGDMREIKWEEVPDFDVLFGGTPCQDLSLAGKRKGLAGERSGLFFEFVRALKEKKPRYFIWENVKGTLSSNAGRDFARVLLEFSEAGYNLWWQVLNAKDFGVPQNRERIFVVGFRDKCPKEIFFEQENNNSYNETSKTQIASTLCATDYKGGSRRQHIIEITHHTTRAYRVFSTEGIAPTLCALGGGPGGKTGLYLVGTSRSYPKKESQKTNQFQQKQHFELDYRNVRIRRLTPKEAERLMSWSDDWTRWGIDEKGNKIEISDTQRYKMCGNGVVSVVVKEIINELL
jgi:DNA (cytosine-5)-methyltransferase 1